MKLLFYKEIVKFKIGIFARYAGPNVFMERKKNELFTTEISG